MSGFSNGEAIGTRCRYGNVDEKLSINAKHKIEIT